MKRVMLFLLGVIFLFVISLLIFQVRNERVVANVVSEKRNISLSEVLQVFPKNTEVLIQFSSEKEGELTVEKSYVIKGNILNETQTSSSEVIVTLDEKYLSLLEAEDVCSIAQEIYKNNAYTYETTLNKAELLWKFRNLLRYRDCLGV